jgi:methylated-DNA-[protein]-cysteine S-methyltransferase
VSECAVLDTPVGRLVLTAGAGAVRRVRWRDGAELQIPDDGSLLQQAVRELVEYFAGRRRHFKVPVDRGPLDASTRRVLAGDGLGGFSGGPPGQELETKRWLLEHEGILQPRLI